MGEWSDATKNRNARNGSDLINANQIRKSNYNMMKSRQSSKLENGMITSQTARDSQANDPFNSENTETLLKQAAAGK